MTQHTPLRRGVPSTLYGKLLDGTQPRVFLGEPLTITDAVRLSEWKIEAHALLRQRRG